MQHVKKPTSVQGDTSSLIQPPRKVNAEVQFTNIEREQSSRDRDTPFAAAKPDYRIAKDEFTQTEQRRAENTINERIPADATDVELLDTRLELHTVTRYMSCVCVCVCVCVWLLYCCTFALSRSSSGFSFVTMCEDNTRQLVLDHHAVESVMGGIATRLATQPRRALL